MGRSDGLGSCCKAEDKKGKDKIFVIELTVDRGVCDAAVRACFSHLRLSLPQYREVTWAPLIVPQTASFAPSSTWLSVRGNSFILAPTSHKEEMAEGYNLS